MIQTCRVCDGQLSHKFQKTQLTYDVSYLECQTCHSLQTETPYWLEEAYSKLNFAIDTGMASRTIYTSKLALGLSLLSNFHADDLCIDFGGGTGLFTRLLRDAGLNAFWDDKYCKNVFSLGFEKVLPTNEPIKLITAFEVLEHLPSPLETLESILGNNPDYFLCSTKLYSGQGSEWWYLLNDGQHVQFYSMKGLELLADRFGYHLQTDRNSFHLFSQKPFPPKFLKKVIKKAEDIRLQKHLQKKFSTRTQKDREYLFHRKDAVISA